MKKKIFRKLMMVFVLVLFLALPVISLAEEYTVEEDVKKEEMKKKEESEKGKEKEETKKEEKTEEEKKAVGLEEMVVTATRTPEKKANLPQVVDIISQKDIRSTVAIDMTDILKKNSSVDVGDATGAYSGIGIRGFQPAYLNIQKHYLLLIDGRPACAPNLATIPPDNIERVEVVKGPASSLYGSEAMGGVINIITKKSRGKIKTDLTLGGGSFETWDGRVAAGGNITDRLDFDFTASYHDQNDDFRMGNGEKRGSTSFERSYGAMRLGSTFAENWRVDIKGDYYYGDINYPSASYYEGSRYGSKKIARFGGDLKLSGPISDNHDFSSTLYSSRDEYEYTDTSATPKYKMSDYHSNWFGGQLQDCYHWRAHQLTIGADYQIIEVVSRSWNSDGTRKAPYRPDSERESLGFFGEAMLKFLDDRLIGTLGGRYDHIDLATKETPYKTDFVPDSADFSHFSPRAGLKFFITESEWQVHSTIGQAFIAPDPVQMAGYWKNWWGGVTRGNKDLEPETSLSWDMGVSFEKKEWGIFTDITYFMTNVDGKIAKVKVSSTEETYENTDEAQIRGLEGELSLDIGTIANWDSSLRLFANFTRLFRAEEQVSTGTRDMQGVADLKVGYGLEYDDGHFFNGRVTARYRGKVNATDWRTPGYPEIEYSPFSVVDLVTNFRVAEHHRFSFKVENLFDKYYGEWEFYPLPGRSFFATYTFTF